MEKSEQREQRPTAAHIESAYHKEEEVKVTPSLPEHRQFKPKKKDEREGMAQLPFSEKRHSGESKPSSIRLSASPANREVVQS